MGKLWGGGNISSAFDMQPLSSLSKILFAFHEHRDCIASADVTKYNISTGENSSLPSLPEPLMGHACTIYNGRLVVSGGYNSSYSRKVWQLEENQWIALPSLRKPRFTFLILVCI